MRQHVTKIKLYMSSFWTFRLSSQKINTNQSDQSIVTTSICSWFGIKIQLQFVFLVSYTFSVTLDSSMVRIPGSGVAWIDASD